MFAVKQKLAPNFVIRARYPKQPNCSRLLTRDSTSTMIRRRKFYVSSKLFGAIVTTISRPSGKQIRTSPPRPQNLAGFRAIFRMTSGLGLCPTCRDLVSDLGRTNTHVLAIGWRPLLPMSLFWLSGYQFLAPGVK